MFFKSIKNKLLVNFLQISSGTLFSRVFGFIRELVVAFYFGTTKYMDAFVVAFIIPTLFRRILGEDMVEKGLMPPVKALIARNEKKKASLLASSLFNIMFLILLMVMVLLYLIVPLLVKFIAPSLEKETFDVAVKLTYVVLPFMVFIGIAAFVGGMLNILEKNLVYGFAPVMLSAGVIFSLIVLRPVIGYYSLPVGFLLGAFLQFLIQVPFLLNKRMRNKNELKYFLNLKIEKESRKKISRESIYIGLQSILNKSVEVVSIILASSLVTGSISGLYFSQRLVQLPNAIIGLAISRAITPYLTEKNALDNLKDFKNGIVYGIKFNLNIILPVVAFSLIMKNEIISIVFKRGDFSEASVYITSLPFWCYMIGLPGMSLNFLLTRSFSAIQQNKVPFYTAIFASVLNILFCIILVKTSLKHGGLALASSIAFTVNTVILYVILNKYLFTKGFQINQFYLVRILLKILMNTACFSFVVYFTADFIKKISFLKDNFPELFVNSIVVVISALTGFILYFIVNYIFKEKRDYRV